VSSEIVFVHPAWIHLLWPTLALVGLLFWLELRRSSTLEQFISRAMQRRLAVSPSAARRMARAGLVGIVLLGCTLALMRPQTAGGVESFESSKMSADVMVLLDVSKSMLAEDAAPSRLERAKADVLDLAAKLKGHRLGLTVFAGRAVILCPLTSDYAFFRMVEKGVSVRSVSPGGTRIGEGIRQAIKAFPDGPGSKLILLVTDGEDHDSNPLEAAKTAIDAGIRIVTIGFGDEKGSEIVLSDPDTGARKVLTDRAGNVVHSRLDGETLRKIALATQGAYVPAGTAALDLESIVRDHIQPLARAAAEKSMRRIPVDHYPWCLLAAIVALLAAAFVGRARVVALVLLMLSTSARADENPRHSYNEARRAFAAKDLAAARKGFLAARDGAQGDVELRYRAAFNLGVTLAQQAQSAAGQEALDELKESAAWFRDAIHLQPDDKDARVCLEVVLRRIGVLADQLNRGQNSLEARLSRVIDDERALRLRLSDLWTRIDAAYATEQPVAFREEFQAAEALQRTLLAEASAISDLAADETAKIQGKGEKERSDEERMRLVMLANMEKYGEVGRSAMADARHVLSRLQIEKAHARVEAALDALKRAREQVQDPVAVLRGLTEDQAGTRVQTAALDELNKKQLKLDSGEIAKAPVWLNGEQLGERQTDLDGRLSELLQRLRAAVEHSGQASSSEPAKDPRMQEVVEAAAEAIAPLEGAQKAMTQTKDALARADLAAAVKSEDDALLGLTRALERFSDIRGLIELTYADQKTLVELLTPSAKPARPLSTEERATRVRDAIDHNRDRLARLERKFQAEQQQLTQAAATPNGGKPSPDAEGQRQLYEQAEAERKSAAQALETLAERVHKRSGDLVGAATLARDHVESLRRLFFSIIEHLKELHESQSKTYDRTAAAKGKKSDADRQAQLAPATDAEQQHAQLGSELVQALRRQADQAAQAKDGAGPDAGKRFGEAAGEVDGATQAMQKAADALKQGTGASATMSLDLQSVLLSQKDALTHLEKAIELLSPPQNQNQDGKQKQQQQKESKQVSNDQADRQLQEIREREAARQREKQNRQRIPSEPVEQDW
jgi:Ca-activated chloride channel family protein